jgi:hypothetical protein
MSVLSLIALFWLRRSARTILAGWAISLTAAGGLAPVVWGESSVAIGILSALASLLIAMGIIWLVMGARGLTRA